MQNNPLDQFYADHCDACNLTDEECSPGSNRERNCVLAAILSRLEDIEKLGKGSL